MAEHAHLFTLIPKTGFWAGPNQAAFLNNVAEYCPSGVEPSDRDGYATFTYYLEGAEGCYHVRLWSTAPGHRKLIAHFDIETTSVGETSTFVFMISPPTGGWIPLETHFVEGNQRVTLKVEFPLDQQGDALIRMYATKKLNPGNIFWLRKIEVFVPCA
jgi:hypothetical protein